MTYARPARDAGHIAPREAAPAERRGHRRLARLAGAIGLVLLTGTLFWMLTDESFTVSPESVTFAGLAHADESLLRAGLVDLERRPNVFRVRASELVTELTARPEVDAASARVTVPADVTITLDERDPVFIWSDGEVSWLVDEDGMLFAPAEAGAGAAADPPPAAPRADLPVVLDARTPIEEPTLGSHLSSADLVVMRLLLAVTPQMLGSQAPELELRIDENNGYVLTNAELGWRALFGHYTPTLQSPTDIPRQVQCLRWLLADRGERRLEQVYLALSEDACGTFSQFAAGEGGGG